MAALRGSDFAVAGRRHSAGAAGKPRGSRYNAPAGREGTQGAARRSGQRYVEPTLAASVGEYVEVLYDPRHLAEVQVYHGGHPICRALCPEHTAAANLDAIRQARRGVRSMRPISPSARASSCWREYDANFRRSWPGGMTPSAMPSVRAEGTAELPDRRTGRIGAAVPADRRA